MKKNNPDIFHGHNIDIDFVRNTKLDTMLDALSKSYDKDHRSSKHDNHKAPPDKHSAEHDKPILVDKDHHSKPNDKPPADKDHHSKPNDQPPGDKDHHSKPNDHHAGDQDHHTNSTDNPRPPACDTDHHTGDNDHHTSDHHTNPNDNPPPVCDTDHQTGDVDHHTSDDHTNPNDNPPPNCGSCCSSDNLAAEIQIGNVLGTHGYGLNEASVTGFDVNGVHGTLGQSMNLSSGGTLLMSQDGNYLYIPGETQATFQEHISYQISDNHGNQLSSTMTIAGLSEPTSSDGDEGNTCTINATPLCLHDVISDTPNTSACNTSSPVHSQTIESNYVANCVTPPMDMHTDLVPPTPEHSLG